jgi:hypothetical protein
MQGDQAMPKQQEGVTDQLVSTIQVIQRSHGTGVLTARRGKNATLEEGVLYFTRGQVTEARVGGHTGTKAFNLLSTWEKCTFVFVFADERDRPLPFVSSSPLSSGSDSLSVRDALHTEENTPPYIAVSPLHKKGVLFHSPEMSKVGEEYSPSMLSLTAIPRLAGQATAILQIFDSTHLSRIHRQICLLVNGQRTVADIMRLSGRSHAEICKLLRDLERTSLLWIQDEPVQR